MWGSRVTSLGLVTRRPGRQTPESQAHPPGAADAPRAGPRASRPAGLRAGDAGLGGHHSPLWPSLPRCVPSLARFSATPAGQETYPVEAVSCVLACRGHRLYSSGWQLSLVAPLQNPAGPGVAEGSPPPAFAPAQGSPSSARPRDLRAAEQLQPPKLDWGWELRGRQKAPTDGQRGKSRVAPKSGEQED